MSERWDGPLERVVYTRPEEPGYMITITSRPDRLLPTVDRFGIVVPTGHKGRVETGVVAAWPWIAKHLHHALRHPAFRAHVEAELARIEPDPSVAQHAKDPAVAALMGDAPE